MSKTPAEGKEGVGGYVPTDLVGRLSLYCAINNISRASLVELVLTNLLNAAPSTDQMIETLAKRVVNIWGGDVANGKPHNKKRWEEFAKDYKPKLFRKKIPSRLADQILARAKKEIFV